MTRLNGSVESAGITDTGMKRKANQDTYCVDDDMGLYIVADGMGGQQGGDVASRLVVETMRTHLREQHDEEPFIHDHAAPDDTLSKQANQLISSIHSANTAVFQKAAVDPLLKGMGSTGSAVFLTDDTVIVANVGDSPVYLVRDHQISPLFVSHSMADVFHDDPVLSERARHMLTRAIGTEKTVKVDSCELQCFKDDIIVLCSDGLSNMVATDTIKTVVENESPDSACRALATLANENGGPDNITIIVVKIKSVRHNTPIKKTWFQKILHAIPEIFKIQRSDHGKSHTEI